MRKVDKETTHFALIPACALGIVISLLALRDESITKISIPHESWEEAFGHKHVNSHIVSSLEIVIGATRWVEELVQSAGQKRRWWISYTATESTYWEVHSDCSLNIVAELGGNTLTLHHLTRLIAVYAIHLAC